MGESGCSTHPAASGPAPATPSAAIASKMRPDAQPHPSSHQRPLPRSPQKPRSQSRAEPCPRQRAFAFEAAGQLGKLPGLIGGKPGIREGFVVSRPSHSLRRVANASGLSLTNAIEWGF
jgi:hypothetical protein